MSVKRYKPAATATVGAYYPVESIELAERTRTDMICDPELHMIIRVIGSPTPAIVRLKSPADVNEVINSLRQTRDQVWPKGGKP